MAKRAKTAKPRKKKEDAALKIAAPENSLRDTVTGLYNKNHLLARLKENMARCERAKEKMALILWDINGFGEFNNEYGQSKGDDLLRTVADTIRASLRVYDEAFRAGPDEFCALLMPADEEIANEVKARLSQTVFKNLFAEGKPYAGHQFAVAGGVVFYPNDHMVPEALLHAAGQALYQERHAPKNES